MSAPQLPLDLRNLVVQAAHTASRSPAIGIGTVCGWEKRVGAGAAQRLPVRLQLPSEVATLFFEPFDMRQQVRVSYDIAMRTAI